MGQPSPWGGRGPRGARAACPTLRRLGLHEGFDEQICGLGVEGQGVAQRLQVGALLQERFLQPHAAGMEVLLEGERPQAAQQLCQGPPGAPRVCASGSEPRGHPKHPRVPSP